MTVPMHRGLVLSLAVATLSVALVGRPQCQGKLAELRKAFDSPLPGQRLAAAKELSKRGSKALGVVKNALSKGSSEARRAATDCAIALGRSAAPLEAELRSALNDRVAWVRAGAAEALGKIGKLEDKSVQALAAHAADPALFVRVNTMQTLAKRKVTSDRKLLLKAAVDCLRVKETGWAAKRFAIEILRRQGKKHSKAVPVLIEALQNCPQGMWDQSQQIADLLLGMGKREALLAALAERMRHADRGGFKNCLRVLERLGKLALPLRPQLEDFLRTSKNRDQKRAARKTLQTLIGRK